MIIIWRLARVGLAAALVVGLAGWGLQRARFGASDDDALARIERELRARLDASADLLGAIAARVAAQRDLIDAAPRDPALARRLFDLVDDALPADEEGRTGLTVYDAAGSPLAWAGRVSATPPKDRLEEGRVMFVAPGALGARLIRIEPVAASDRLQAPRTGTIVVEQVIGGIPESPVLLDTLIVPTSLAPVAVSPSYREPATRHNPYTFQIQSRGGGALVDAEVDPRDLAASRTRWQNGVRAAVLAVLALTLLVCAGPLVERRRHARNARMTAVTTSAIVLILGGGRLLLWLAAAPFVDHRAFASPVDLLLNALLVGALAWLAVDSIQRRRVARPRPPLALVPASLGLLAAAYGASGAATAIWVYLYERFLEQVVSGTSLDLIRFSLHPVTPMRLTFAFGLVLMHAGVLWIGAALTRLPSLLGRTPRAVAPRASVALAWLAGVLAAVLALGGRRADAPIVPMLVAIAVTGGCALVSFRVHVQPRHRSRAVWLGALFLAVLAPAAATYPSLLAYSTAAKERLVARDFGPQVLSQRSDLQDLLESALSEIDAQPSLPDFVGEPARPPAPNTDYAFQVWSLTDLATYRLTSAIELYAEGGRLVSRFALNLPEYETVSHTASSCGWEVVEEISQFGSSERHVLRADRGICENRRVLGSIVVRVMLDPKTLPFISSQTPYVESLRATGASVQETASGRDVELVVYGWSRAPIYESGTTVWPLPDDVFRRLMASRDTFWATLTRGRDRFRVYLFTDRGGMYALGFPVTTWFGHLVSLAELVILTLVLYVLLLGAAALFHAATSRAPASGRVLWREIRTSFYRKLFLFFVAAAVVPVITLAIATRTYFARQFNDSVEEVAARTATVAQRLVEDYATLQQRGAGTLQSLDDQIMVLVSRAIDQDVNLFDRDHLQATSERDLFASELLSPRTPADVYRRIVLDRLPTYVGTQQVGDFAYLIAAAPVRAGAGSAGIVTVPQTTRQREIDQQIDELDRRVLFGFVLFSLVGAAIGYWMAERIADPVNRLTRATRRIARGDLDAQIASASADELGRLVADFNTMAQDLKRQRADLERTQRLEAWADMARQVAHDIKNPLTPIQLSAEHARRVNVDRGRPLSPVLDECVNTILNQVRLLRQISAEFSSFASAPTPRPEPTRLPELMADVVDPYRAPLAGRIDVTLDVPPNLPVATIDRTLFARALTNIIENALHAMPGHGTLAIAAVGEPGRIVVSVADTGVGMDVDALDRIFEPYFSTKATGTGLGLTIAKRNIELNGGEIKVSSQRGTGTTVTITLPAA